LGAANLRGEVLVEEKYELNTALGGAKGWLVANRQRHWEGDEREDPAILGRELGQKKHHS